MNYKDDLKIIEIDKLNSNEIRFYKGKSKINLFLIIILIKFFLFIIIYFFLVALNKNINYIIKFIHNENFLNQKILFF